MVYYPLDLYQTILWQLFTLEHAQRRFREVMTVVFALKEPLPLSSSSTLFDHDQYLKVRNIIPVMASLLDGALDEQKPIPPHPFTWFSHALGRSKIGAAMSRQGGVRLRVRFPSENFRRGVRGLQEASLR